MTRIYKILFIAILVSDISFSQNEIKKLPTGFSSITGDNKIHFSLNDYELKDVNINGQIFKKPVVPFA